MHPLTKYSWLTTAVVLIAGFLLLHLGAVGYGLSFFLLFPVVVGFTIGTHPRRERDWGSLILGSVIFFGFLLAGALEGVLCVAMAFPIFLVSLLVGWLCRNRFITGTRPPRKTSDHLLVSVTPLLILLLADQLEGWVLPASAVVTIESSVLLDYPAPLVFDQVKSMRKLDAEKPWGIWLGLPAPHSCELLADTVGARRYCRFDNGHIVAEITKYDHGKLLEMDVIDYTLTGREWFQFVDATYSFARVDGQTKITRTSSYRSTLRPRWYWQPLESWGISQEHDFVLASLRKNLSEL